LRISENEKKLSIVFHVCTDHLHHLVDLILFFSGTSFFQNVEDERHFLWSELDSFLVRTGDERHHNGSQRSPAFAGGLFGCKPDQLQFDRVHSLHGRILEKIGADQVIYPERSMGIRVARNFTASGFEDVFELSTEFSMAEFRIPNEWVGKSLSEIRLREQHHINLVAVKHGDSVNVNLNPAEKLEAGCILVAVGKNEDLNKFRKPL